MDQNVTVTAGRVLVGAAQGQAAKDPQVAVSVKGLEDASTALVNALDRLESKLAPAMTPPIPIVEDGGAPVHEVLCPLAEEVAGNAVRIWQQVRRIDHLARRLQI